MKQLNLFSMPALVKTVRPNMTVNRLDTADRAVHDWYRFVLSFPPHLVRDYLEKFDLRSGQTILDPFCGTGTTVVEAKLHGLRAIGIEANTLAHFASTVKTTRDIDPDGLAGHASTIAATTHRRPPLRPGGWRTQREAQRCASGRGMVGDCLPDGR